MTDTEIAALIGGGGAVAAGAGGLRDRKHKHADRLTAAHAERFGWSEDRAAKERAHLLRRHLGLRVRIRRWRGK